MTQLDLILKEIAEIATQYGRDPKEIHLIAVTKDKSWNEIVPLYHAGQRTFGESRPLQAIEKHELAPKNCNWHLIGTLQSNKVRKVIGHFSLIHSVDSLELARKISLYSQEANLTTSILLQANTSGEANKHGACPEEWITHTEELFKLPSLSIEGLMTMAPLAGTEKITRDCFSKLRKLRDQLQIIAGSAANLTHLSMGMSDDFKWAIAEGATLLRIGRALF